MADTSLEEENKRLKKTVELLNKNYEAAVKAGREMAKELFDRERAITALQNELAIKEK